MINYLELELMIIITKEYVYKVVISFIIYNLWV